MTTNAQAGAISFAHLAGITRPIHAAKADGPADDKDDKKDAAAQGEDESDEDYAKRMETDGTDDEKDKENAARADADPDDVDDGDKKDDKAKKATRSAVARGVAQERARWTAVVGSRAFARNPAVGAHLLASTPLSASAVLDVLRDTPVAAAGDRSRSERNPNLGPSAPTVATGAAAVDTRWSAAFKRAGITK